MVRIPLAVTGLILLLSCTKQPPAAVHEGSQEAASASASSAEATAPREAVVDAAAPVAPTSDLPSKPGRHDVTKPSPPAELAEWLKKKVPSNATVEGDPPKVIHTVQSDEDANKLAEIYLPLSEIYMKADLTAEIQKKGPAPGKKIEIPGITTRVIHDDPRDERLGWPEDKALRGVFVTGPYAGIRWQDTIDKLAERGLNAIVLDQKDYEGYVNYPTKTKIGVETQAMQKMHIPDLARAVRFAHWKGIRIISRIPCFHDPWADKHAKDARLSIKFPATNKPIHVEWLDPVNTEAQDYAIDLAKEGIEAGVDEIQLDYVRFPVHLSQKVAVLPDKEERPKIIRDFVKRVHAVTSEAGVALSCDFFGVAATGEKDDILYLGQHIPTVAPEADAISLMSYPSHYNRGYLGFAEPGDHPEIVGISNAAAVKQLKPTGARTIFRTWLQAFPLRSPSYGPKYVVDEAKSAEANGGVGWLMWSPACEYSAVWNGFPKIAKK